MNAVDSPLIRGGEHHKAELLSDILLAQGENLAIVGMNSTGKSTLAAHILKLHGCEGNTVYCSSRISVANLKSAIKDFECARRHNSTKRRQVAILVSDLHMAYPKNTAVIEFLRFLGTYKGYYATNSCSFKSIEGLSLIYTADKKASEDSVHIARLLNRTVKLHLKSEVNQSLLVEHWINPLTSVKDDVKEKFVSVTKKCIHCIQVSNRVLHNACKVLRNANHAYPGMLLYSELLMALHDRVQDKDQRRQALEIIKKEVLKEFKTSSLDETYFVEDYMNSLQIPVTVEEIKTILRVTFLTKEIPFINFDVIITYNY